MARSITGIEMLHLWRTEAKRGQRRYLFFLSLEHRLYPSFVNGLGVYWHYTTTSSFFVHFLYSEHTQYQRGKTIKGMVVSRQIAAPATTVEVAVPMGEIYSTHQINTFRESMQFASCS